MISTEILSGLSKKSLGLTFVLSAAAFAFAQEKVNVTGKVTDAQNLPVPYASLTFTHPTNTLFSDAILSDENGNFSVALVPANYQVAIEAINYKKSAVSRQISKAGVLEPFVIEIDADASLLTPTQEIEGVNIVAQATKPYRVELDKKIYDPSQDVLSKGGNLQDVLSNVPSVSVDTDGTVSMRGNTNVRFLINGKPSSLLGIDSGANALQSIPADQIERIEVITNPSSKFEASGTAGILNIILKKQKGRGFNGSVEGSLGYLPSTRLNTNLSWRKGSWIWFVNGGGSYNERRSKRDNFTKYFDESGNITRQLDQTNINNSYQNSYNFNPGFSVDLSEKATFNLSGMLRYFTSESQGDVNYSEYGNGFSPVNSVRSTTGTGENLALQGDAGFDYKFNDDGHNLYTSISLQRNRGEDLTDIEERENSIFLLRDYIGQQTNTNSIIGKLDYELPLGENSKIEAGYRFDRNNNEYDNNVFDSNVDDGPLNVVTNFTSDVIYRETFNAFYAQFKSKVNKLGYQLGLRTEISDIFIDSSNLIGDVLVTNKNYTGLFPSIFLSYDVGKNDNQILLNYSRRINRPRSWFLIPFSTSSLTDDRNRFFGNTNLNPEYVNSFELGYAIQKKKLTFNPTLYYRKTEDETQFVTYLTVDGDNPDTFINVSTPFNVGSEWQYGLDLNFSYDLFSWWKLLGNLDLYGYGSEGSFFDASFMDEPQSFDGKGFAVGSRLTNTFKIDKTFNVQVQGFYRGAEKTASNDRKAMYALNLGANKTIWKGNGTIAFNIQDIFNTRARQVTSFGPNWERESYMQWNPRQFNISFTYRFKQGEKVQQPKKKRDNNSNYSGDDDGSM